MPTPEHIRAASREKRKRICVICGAHFMVPSVERIGRTCSNECGRKHQGNLAAARVHSPETKAKRVQSLKAAWADPERRSKWTAKTRAAMRDWHKDPDNAAAFAARSSERMKRRHADPEWQKVRDKRSSATMKTTWETRREQFTVQAAERYLRHEEAGTGINSPDAKRRKAIAVQWIMKKAQEAFHAETEYNAVYAEVQARLRREMPYDGPQEGSDYMDYLQMLGRAVTCSPECRTIADTFLSEAISRFAKAWNARRDSAPPQSKDG